MGFSRQEYWSGLPFPSPGDLPDPGIKPGSPALQANALTSEPPGKPTLDMLDIFEWYVLLQRWLMLILCSFNVFFPSGIVCDILWVFSFFCIYFFGFIFWLYGVFVAVCGLSLVVVIRGYSRLGVWASRCHGFSFVERSLWALGLGSCGMRVLEHRVSGCGTGAYLLRGI